MEWSREWVGGRASIALTFVVALLSIATGIANLAPGVTPSGPLADVVPPLLVATAGFTGTLTGFVLLVSAFGLRRGLAAAWYAVVVLLPLTAAQGLLQASEYSLPLVVLSLVAFVVVLLNRRRFDRRIDVGATQLAAAAAIAAALSYGTLGTFQLREEFDGVASAPTPALLDAFYFTLVTASTVGYGDVTPVTPRARLFGLSVLLVGTTSFAVALGVILAPAIEARLTSALGRMTSSQLDLLENHVLVLGYGDLTEPIIEELGDRVQYLVVTPNEEQARALRERGVEVLTADPSDEAPLQRAHVEEARAVVTATNNDAQDALAILTARQLNPGVPIVAAATQRENIRKLKRAGADTVVSPATIGGRLLVRSALEGNVDRDHDGEVDLEEIATFIEDESGDRSGDYSDSDPGNGSRESGGRNESDERREASGSDDR